MDRELAKKLVTVTAHQRNTTFDRIPQLGLWAAQQYLAPTFFDSLIAQRIQSSSEIELLDQAASNLPDLLPLRPAPPTTPNRPLNSLRKTAQQYYKPPVAKAFNFNDSYQELREQVDLLPNPIKRPASSSALPPAKLQRMEVPNESPGLSSVKTSVPRTEPVAPSAPAEPERPERPAFRSGNDVAYDLARKKNPSMPPQPAKPKKTLGGKFVPPLKSNVQSRMTGDEREVSKQVFANKQAAGGKSNAGAEIDNINGVPLDDERLRNIEPRLLQLIQNEILDRAQKIVWDDIAGLKLAKQTITEMVIMPLLRPDIFTGIRKPPRGLLLFGPPGTGKTMIGRAIASECDSTFFAISASSLTSKWVGEGEKMVRALFAVASCYSPAVIFIDEIDSLLTARSEKEDDSARRIKTEFLIQLEGATNESDAMILLIGATNRPQELDDAARRRLAKRLYIPLPDHEARCDLLRRLLSKGIQHSLTDAQLSHLSTLSKGYSGADISLLVQDAALYPIREIPDIRTASTTDVRPLNLQDFERALRVVKASVGAESLQQYRDWNQKFGSADIADGD